MGRIAGNLFPAAVPIKSPLAVTLQTHGVIFSAYRRKRRQLHRQWRAPHPRPRLSAAASPLLGVRSRPRPQTLPASNRLEAASGPGRSLI